MTTIDPNAGEPRGIPGVTDDQPPQPAGGRQEWQRKLLPLMAGMVVGLTLFFFLASLLQLYLVNGRIEQGPRLDVEKLLEVSDARSTNAQDFAAARWQALVMLEAHAMEQRYHQANVLLLTRVWVRYLGFVTGMIFGLVGAAFILGKMREPASSLSAEGGGFKGALTTTSPGLFLAALGTVLMITAMTTHNPIEVRDGPLFTNAGGLSAATVRPPEDVSRLESGRDAPANTKDASESGRSAEGILNEVDERINP